MTDWDRSIFDGDLEALLDVRPPVPISRINAIRDLALNHPEHLNYITQRILRFLESSPPDYRVAGLYLIDAIIRKPKDSQSECAVNDYRQRFQAVLRDHTLQGLFDLCSEEDKARVSRVLTYWGGKIYPKQFAEQLKMDAIQEPNVPRRQPTVIPNHNMANENLQQTLQTPFPTIPSNPTDLTHFLASLQNTATNQTGIQQGNFTCQALRSLSSSFNLQVLSHYPPALHHFLQGLQLGAHLPAIALNGALPSLFQPPPPPPEQPQQPTPYATTNLPGMQPIFTNTTFDDNSAVKYECVQDEVVPSCQIALQQAQSHSPSPSLSVPTSSTAATDHDIVPVKQEPLGDNEPVALESTQSTLQNPSFSSTTIPVATTSVAASSSSSSSPPPPPDRPTATPPPPPPPPDQLRATVSTEPIMAPTVESIPVSLPVPSPEAVLSPKQASPSPSISTTLNPPLSETIPPPKTPPLPPVVKKEDVVSTISVDNVQSQSIQSQSTSIHDSVKRPLSPSILSRDKDITVDSSQTVDNNRKTKRQRCEKDASHESSNQNTKSAKPTRKSSRWDIKGTDVTNRKTSPLPRPKTPPLRHETRAKAPTTEVSTSIELDTTTMMEGVVEQSTSSSHQQLSETHMQQPSTSLNSAAPNVVPSTYSAHEIMNNNIPRPKTPPTPTPTAQDLSSLSTGNEITSASPKTIPRPKTPPRSTQPADSNVQSTTKSTTKDTLQDTVNNSRHSQQKSAKRHHSPSPSSDKSNRQPTDIMNDQSAGSQQQQSVDDESSSNKRRKKMPNDHSIKDTRDKPKVSNDECKSSKDSVGEENKATLTVKKSSKDKESKSVTDHSTSKSPTAKESSSAAKHLTTKKSSPTAKHSSAKESSSSEKRSKAKESSSSSRHSKEKDKMAKESRSSHESSTRSSTRLTKSTSEKSSTSKANERTQAHSTKSSEKNSSSARSNEPSRSSRDSDHKRSYKERSKGDTSERHRAERHNHYRDASPSKYSHNDEDRRSPNTYYTAQPYSPSAPTPISVLSPFARPGPLADSRLKQGFIKVLTRTMYVGPMPPDVVEKDIRDLFSQYGEILSVMFNDRPDKRRNAFVQFGNRDSLAAAKEGSQHLRMKGKPVTVNWAHGFGPKSLYNYEKGYTIINLDELKTEETASLRSAPVGGFQGSRIRDQVIVEEPGPLGTRQSTLRQPPSASPQSEHHQQPYESPMQHTPPTHHQQSPIPPPPVSLSQSQHPQYHEGHYPSEPYPSQPYTAYYPGVASPSPANPPVDPYQGVKFEQMHDYDVAQPAYPYHYFSGAHYPPPSSAPPTMHPPHPHPPMHPSYYQRPSQPYPYPEQEQNVYYQHYYYPQQPPPQGNPYYYGYNDGYR